MTSVDTASPVLYFKHTRMQIHGQPSHRLAMVTMTFSFIITHTLSILLCISSSVFTVFIFIGRLSQVFVEEKVGYQKHLSSSLFFFDINKKKSFLAFSQSSKILTMTPIFFLSHFLYCFFCIFISLVLWVSPSLSSSCFVSVFSIYFSFHILIIFSPYKFPSICVLLRRNWGILAQCGKRPCS